MCATLSTGRGSSGRSAVISGDEVPGGLLALSGGQPQASHGAVRPAYGSEDPPASGAESSDQRQNLGERMKVSILL